MRMLPPYILALTLALSLAVGLTLAVASPAGAAPAFVPLSVKDESDIVPVVSSRTVRRHDTHQDGGIFKKKRRHHHEGERAERRHHGDFKHKRGHSDDRDWIYRPRATPKYAYDAYGNYRIYDGDRWDGDSRWEGRDRRLRKHRQRIIRDGFRSTVPSPELLEILTAVPKAK